MQGFNMHGSDLNWSFATWRQSMIYLNSSLLRAEIWASKTRGCNEEDDAWTAANWNKEDGIEDFEDFLFWLKIGELNLFSLTSYNTVLSSTELDWCWIEDYWKPDCSDTDSATWHTTEAVLSLKNSIFHFFVKWQQKDSHHANKQYSGCCKCINIDHEWSPKSCGHVLCQPILPWEFVIGFLVRLVIALQQF